MTSLPLSVTPGLPMFLLTSCTGARTAPESDFMLLSCHQTVGVDKLCALCPHATGRGASPEQAARMHKLTRCSGSQDRPHSHSRGLEGGSRGGSMLQTSAPPLLCVMTRPADSPSFETHKVEGRPGPRGRAHHTHSWCSQLG